jgi:hypothetical protein
MNTQVLPLRKAYVDGCCRREKPEEHVVDFLFGSNPDKAEPWLTKADADMQCAFLMTREIEILLRNGGKHICKGFKSEQRASGEFVVSCEIPPVEYQLR